MREPRIFQEASRSSTKRASDQAVMGSSSFHYLRDWCIFVLPPDCAS